jgi:hypothetical protein
MLTRALKPPRRNATPGSVTRTLSPRSGECQHCQTEPAPRTGPRSRDCREGAPTRKTEPPCAHFQQSAHDARHRAARACYSAWTTTHHPAATRPQRTAMRRHCHRYLRRRTIQPRETSVHFTWLNPQTAAWMSVTRIDELKRAWSSAGLTIAMRGGYDHVRMKSTQRRDR